MSISTELPTLYEYYTKGGIKAGLQPHCDYFTLNNKNITIYSGALHYFRVHPAYWQDRLRKLRAAGLNAIETYVPWNLHEPEQGKYDFGKGGTDFQKFLDLENFLQLAKEEDLLVIIRPGPYICAEWEFGGLPSWLLRCNDIKLRTSDEIFIKHVQNYFDVLLKLLGRHQFTCGGPIIAFQIENEYGNIRVDNEPVDVDYLEKLRIMFLTNGIVELLFTADTPSNGISGSLPGVLYAANFQDNCKAELDLLKKYYPHEPCLVMEYWSGWFDHWTEKHHIRSSDDFLKVLQDILDYPASVNMYMFHGGTTWGFLNGANVTDSSTNNSTITHDTTSYDYDAPLSEAGDYTKKYFTVKELLKKYNTVQTKLPDLPELEERVAYKDIQITEELPLVSLITNQSENLIESVQVQAMENLPINNNNGQSYGYIIYRKENINISANSILKIAGHVCDTIMVLINGRLVSKILESKEDFNGFGYWRLKDSTLNMGSKSVENATVDLVVENWGRCNYGKLNQFNQFKGLWQGNVTINDETLTNWKIFPMEFKKSWITKLKEWQMPTFSDGPKFYKGIFSVSKPIRDTFIDMRSWNKGVVIINDFVLSRYCFLGPQQTAYLPAPFLKEGENQIVIFEHFRPDKVIKFSKEAIFETRE